MQTVWSLVLIFGFHTAHPQPHVEAIGLPSQQACVAEAVKRLANIHVGDIAVQCVPGRGVEI